MGNLVNINVISIFLLYFIVIIVNVFLVFNFFVRLVGVETQRWSTSYSIFQIINLIPRSIGIFQIPLITLYTENALFRGNSVSILFYQGVILFNLLGLLFGIFLLPFFQSSLGTTIKKVQKINSFKAILKRDVLILIYEGFKRGDFKIYYTGINFFDIQNKNLFFSNLISSFLQCIAFPACVLIGYQIPEYRATIISLVSLIYGMASIITILSIDTRLGVKSDSAFHGNISLLSFKIVLFDCIKGKILGTFIGILLLPIITSFFISLIKLVVF